MKLRFLVINIGKGHGGLNMYLCNNDVGRGRAFELVYNVNVKF